MEKRSLFQYDRFLARIRNEKPYFLDLIQLKDFMDGYAFVRPMHDNPRLKAQQGLFLLFGIRDCNKELFPKVKDVLINSDASGLIAKIDLNPPFRDIIREELKLFANIDGSRLFPEPDKITKQIELDLGLKKKKNI